MQTIYRTIALLAAAASLTAADAPPLAGMWGSGDALLALDAQGGRLQTGCLLARIAPVRPDARGQFSVSAQVEILSLMPPQGEDDAPEEPAPVPAKGQLTGQIRGGTVELTLAMEGQAPRRLVLALGQRATPARCL